MADVRFSKRQVVRAFRKFKDITSDLSGAHHVAWGDSFSRLIAHCENDPVMRVVTEPLRANTNVDAEAWYRRMMGESENESDEFRLPHDDEERTALLYQFFLMVESNKVDIDNFCINVFGVGHAEDTVVVFNSELVDKFTREVSYRLDEVLEDIGDLAEVPPEAVRPFHFHNYHTEVHGPIQGSVVAFPGASIANSTASYNSREELGAALESLRPMLRDIATNQRKAVESPCPCSFRRTNPMLPQPTRFRRPPGRLRRRHRRWVRSSRILLGRSESHSPVL